jgi:hypothetical protein
MGAALDSSPTFLTVDPVPSTIRKIIDSGVVVSLHSNSSARV